jgi:hypothetical protein
MNTNKSTTGIDPKVKLSLLWIFVVLLMVYADIVSLMDPSYLERRFAFDNISSPFQPLETGWRPQFYESPI